MSLNIRFWRVYPNISICEPNSVISFQSNHFVVLWATMTCLCYTVEKLSKRHWISDCFLLLLYAALKEQFRCYIFHCDVSIYLFTLSSTRNLRIGVRNWNWKLQVGNNFKIPYCRFIIVFGQLDECYQTLPN